jgi:hypothetical protein
VLCSSAMRLLSSWFREDVAASAERPTQPPESIEPPLVIPLHKGRHIAHRHPGGMVEASDV